jgi:predicted transcriptional regulator
MKEQYETKQVSSSDLQGILDRLSALEQENADLKASNVELQEAIQQLEVRTQENVSSVRKEALGWTLEGEGHPVAQQIQERFQAEREFIIGGITSNLQLAFGEILDRHSPDV